MDKNEVTKRVKKVVSAVLAQNETEIADDANFIFDLGADSAQTLEMIVAFEKEFGISIDKEKAMAIQSIEDAVGYISGAAK
jgi:acyl carrier protein